MSEVPLYIRLVICPMSPDFWGSGDLGSYEGSWRLFELEIGCLRLATSKPFLKFQLESQI